MGWPFLDTVRPFGLAHQGGDEVAPGNTMAAFEHAVSLGVTFLETDVQATADGVLVVFHDDDLRALAGVEARVGELCWAELAELRVDGHPIPRFDDLVERFGGVRFNIDPKSEEAVEPLVEAIRRHDLVDRVLVGSFSDRRIRAVRRAIGAGLATSPGPFGLVGVLIRALVLPWWRPSYAAVQIPTRYGPVPLTSAFLIRRYHRLGLDVHVWTVNDGSAMDDLFDRGVDAIISDKPTVLRRVLRARNAWPEDGGSGDG